MYLDTFMHGKAFGYIYTFQVYLDMDRATCKASIDMIGM